MAVKVSGLPNSNDFNGQEQVLVIQDGVSKQGSLSSFTPYLSSELVTYDKLDDLSGNWEATYTTVQDSSGGWEYTKTYVQDNSATWDADLNVVSEFQDSSGGWDDTSTTVQTNSSAWIIDTLYDDSTLQAASGSWNYTTTFVQDNSATWDTDLNVVNEFQASSGVWDDASTTVSASSAQWATVYDDTPVTELQAASAEWDDTSTTVQTNSAGWDSHSDLTDIIAASGSWDSTYSTVQTSSASWASHADITVLQSTSAEWDDTSTAVQTNSSAWAIDTIYDDTDVAAYLNGNLNTHIIPLSNQTYDLGDAEHKFRHLYLSTSTIYMGESSTPITLEDGKLSVGGDIVAQSPLPQAITPLSAYEAPAPYIIDLAQCMNAEIILTSNMSLQLTGAEKGQSGMFALGNGNAHDGVGFTVDFYPDNIVSQTHAEGGHSVMAGDLADFAVAPAAGEYNYGTIGWYYTGTEYLLYVSEVKPFTTAIQPNVDGGVLVSGVTDVPAVNGSYYKGSGTVDGYDWWYLPGTNFVIWNDGFFANISDAGDGTDTNPGSFTINTYWWAGDGTNSSYPAFTYSGAQGSSDTATVTLIA